MKKNKLVRRVLIGCFGTMMLGALSLGLNGLNEVEAVADTENYFVQGASVRIADDGDNGIRFAVCYDGSVENLEESGTLVIPKDVLGEKTLNVDNTDARKIDTTEVWTEYVDENTQTTYQRSIAYLYGIPAASYSRTLSVCGYLKFDDKYTYTEVREYSFYDTAASALAANDYKTESQKKLLEAYNSKAPDGTFVDFSTEEAAAVATAQGAPTSYVESYAGGENLVKIEFSGDPAKNYYYTENTAWKASYWKNYYADYTHVTVNVYVENLAPLNALRVDGLVNNTQTQLALRSNGNGLSEGWNSVSFPMTQEKLGNIDSTVWYEGFSNKVRVFGSTLADYKTAGAQSSYVYLESVFASNTLAVTNSHTGGLMSGAKYVVKDDAATVFEGYSELTLTVYSADGKQVVTDGEFMPANAGNHLFVYTATGADGKAYRASYNVDISMAEAGLINDFSNSNGWVPLFNANYHDEYDGKTGVIEGLATAAETGGPVTKGLFNSGKRFAIFDKADYASATKINFLVKVVKNNPNLIVSMELVNNNNAVSLSNAVLSDQGVTNEEWQTISLDFASYYAVFDTVATNTKLALTAKLPTDMRDEENCKNITASVYIDKVWVS